MPQTDLERELIETRFQRDTFESQVALLRAELGDLRPRVSNQAHTIAMLRRELDALRAPAQATPAAPSEPLPTTDRFHNGG